MQSLLNMPTATPPLRIVFSTKNTPAPLCSVRKTGRIVLAEDHEALRHLLASRLRKEGHTVSECSNGVELLDHLGEMLDRGRTCAIDLIISDVRMPGLTGMEILSGLRSLGNNIPIILITAFGGEEFRTEARDLGVTESFDKPFDVDEFLAAIEKHI